MTYIYIYIYTGCFTKKRLFRDFDIDNWAAVPALASALTLASAQALQMFYFKFKKFYEKQNARQYSL